MLKRLYEWVMRWAEGPYATPALFILALAESSFFPLPPDVLLIALGISVPRRALFYAAVCTAGSVIGGVIGYGIGYQFYDIAGKSIIEFYGVGDQFAYVGERYNESAFAAIAIAGFTPIPYKVFTIAAGVFKVPLSTLVMASLLSRAGRFFLVGGLIRLFGASMKGYIERYFNWLSIAFVVLLVLGFVVARWVVH
jgi:membrane protein YqaA with SNARE-associated domain